MKDLKLQYWVICRNFTVGYVVAHDEPFDEYLDAKEFASNLPDHLDARVTMEVVA